jgi:hypothetical protein
LLDAQGAGQETQDARDGPKADAGLDKELQGSPHHINLRQNGPGLRWALELAQTRLGRFEGVSGTVALGGDTSALFALVALAVAALLGFVLPRLSTVCDCGKVTHRTRAHPPP